MSKLSAGTVQVVMTDQAGGGPAADLARELRAVLEKGRSYQTMLLNKLHKYMLLQQNYHNTTKFKKNRLCYLNMCVMLDVLQINKDLTDTESLI